MSNRTNAVDDVNEIELAAIKRDRERVAALRAELGALAIDLHGRERDVIRRIEAGARVAGSAVVIVRRRQNISWLTVYAHAETMCPLCGASVGEPLAEDA